MTYSRFSIQHALCVIPAFALLVSGCGIGPSIAPNNGPVPASITLTQSSTEVDSTILNNFTLVSVMINDTGPYTFVLDTGASVAAVSPRIAQQFPGSLSGMITINDTLDTNLFQVDKLQMGALVVENFHAAVVDLDQILSDLGMPIDGIVGLPIFSTLTLTLDYPRSKVGVRTEPTFDKDNNCLTLVAERLDSGLLSIPVHVVDRYVQALLDSGNNAFLDLPSYFSDLDYQHPTTTTSYYTLTGPVDVTHACLQSGTIGVGCIEYSNVCVDLGSPDTIIGAYALTPFAVSIDQPSLLVHFEPPGP